MSLRFRWVSVLLLGLAISDPLAATPRPAKSDYFETVGGSFLHQDGESVYAMIYRIRKPLPDGHVLKLAFENPQDKKVPVTETRRLEYKDDRIIVQSVPLACIKNGRQYLVTLELFADDSSAKRMAIHKQKVEFKLPMEFVRQAGIKLC